MVATEPYRAYALIFHLGTLLMVFGVLWKPARMGRLAAGYMDVNFLIIGRFRGGSLKKGLGM